METCCTCTAFLSSTISEKSEKLVPEYRRVPCCDRFICTECINNNPRFGDYCPFCQVSTAPSSLPQRLKEPPSYTSVPPSTSKTTDISYAPPPYATHAPSTNASFTESRSATGDPEKGAVEDTLHFLDHKHDTVTSLAFRYGVPAAALRQTNNLHSDHLLLGRRSILIPGEYYKAGISLSPRPVEGEEEELRKNKIRRFMISCKVSEYDVALLYLEQSNYDLEDAAEAYLEDERWESEHPAAKAKGVTKNGLRKSSPFWRGL